MGPPRGHHIRARRAPPLAPTRARRRQGERLHQLYVQVRVRGDKDQQGDRTSGGVCVCVVCEGSGRECGAPHPHTPSHTLTHPNTACTVVLLHSPCRVCPTARCSERSYEGKLLMGVP